MMEKNRMIKRILTVVLPAITVIGLTMQGTPAFAETPLPEGQSDNRWETSEERESVEQTETEEAELPEKQIEEVVKEQSVSQNDISAGETDGQNGTVAAPVDEGADDKNNILNDEILKKCIVNGTNPSGVTVNLFDYSQGVILDGSREVAHDYYYEKDWDDGIGGYANKGMVYTYNLGISQGHLLRFGYLDEKCNDCKDYGNWNKYHTTRHKDIVQKKLYNGYPRLNLSNESNYGQYNDEVNRADYLTEEKMTESLAYLFSPYSATYKASYNAVQGLFQQDAKGYYYYNSRENFASFNKDTNSFILYNSPGVANVVNNHVYAGQFFPFNTADYVFDSYIENNDGRYKLTYKNINGNNDRGENPDDSKENNYDPIGTGGNGYIKCYAPNLNHYLGLTLEMRFVQPEGGCVAGNTDESAPMIFSFSGDDDVWIFIDDVLVADLGGLHDALELTINFATGEVKVAGETRTLRQAFVTAYGEDSIPSSVKFSEVNENTFADNTVHTLKMFYLERGHMASNLSLSFNIQPLPSPPSENEDKHENIDETEEHTSDSDTDANVIVEISVSDNTLYDSSEIPKTGDDSLIGWWAALCIISLVGIGATVCNLIIRKRNQDK